MLNTVFENVETFEREELFEQNKIESGLNLSDSYFSKILSSSCQVVDGYSQIEGGELKYGGRITYNIVYEGEGIERLEAGAEFSFKKIIGSENGDAVANFNVNNLSIKSSGGMLYAEAILETKIAISRQKQREYLADIDCLKKMNILEESKTTNFSSSFQLDDEFETIKVKKVLQSNVCGYVSSILPTFDGARVDGELICSLVLLPFGQNSDIVKERRVIPFSLELDLLGVRENSKLSVENLVAKNSLRVSTTEDEQTSTITVLADLKLNVRAENVEEKACVCDCFSNNYFLEKQTSALEEKRLVGYECQTEKVKDKFICAVPENSRFISLVAEDIQLISSYLEKDNYKIDALITADALFNDGENNLVCRKAQMAVTFIVKADGQDISGVFLVLYSLSAKLRSGQIEGEATIKISYEKNEKVSNLIVVGVHEKGEKQVNNSAISVYLGKKGDTEWDVMTSLGEDMDAIFALNPTLEFPLVGGEKVICYRRKTKN